MGQDADDLVEDFVGAGKVSEHIVREESCYDTRLAYSRRETLTARLLDPTPQEPIHHKRLKL
ncbi:hypothetical protein CKO23_12330 [Thiocystis violacea]|nr:hypothetical protein [Thiocystis violacea]